MSDQAAAVLTISINHLLINALTKTLQDLSLHIEYLLRYHDCVIVPGIGAFLRSRIPAHFDEVTGELSPARRQVSFNASISTDDGLLAHSISRRENMSFEQARASLTQTTDALHSVLREDGTVSLNHIGNFAINEEGAICFTPHVNYYPALALPILAPSAKSEEPEAAASQEATEKLYFVIRLPKRVMRYAAMLMVVIAAAFSLSGPMYDNALPADTASVVPLPESAPKVTAPVADNSNATQTTVMTAEDFTPRYYLIVGASHSKSKCEEFISQHPDQELGELTTGSTKRLIYLASAAEKEELLELMRDQDVKKEFGQTWIYDSEK